MSLEQIRTWGEVRFREPASEEQLVRCEQRLGHRLPESLRVLLAQSNGIDYGDGGELIFSAEYIAEDNVERRTDPEMAEMYMPFEGMVFFATPGTGDRFVLALSGRQEVFSWDPYDDSRRWVANDPLHLLQVWLTGELSV